jgi:hypothetical protein
MCRHITLQEVPQVAMAVPALISAATALIPICKDCVLISLSQLREEDTLFVVIWPSSGY